MRLVHLTDPHLSTLDGVTLGHVKGKRKLGWLSWNRRRRRRHLAAALAAIDAAVRTEHADLVIVSGDLVQIGLGHEIAAARRWLDGFAPVPLVLVPGNHDFYQADAVAPALAAWAPYLHLETGAGLDAFPTCSDHGDVSIIGLCSAAPMPLWSAGGELGTAQLERLDHLLETCRDRWRCVVLHHPPYPGACSRRKALRDAGALSAVLDRHAVELVLHGHVHRNEARVLAGGSRVFATASASNVAREGRASYRVFDVLPCADGWQVAMRLMSLAVDGSVTAAAECRWQDAPRG